MGNSSCICDSVSYKKYAKLAARLHILATTKTTYFPVVLELLVLTKEATESRYEYVFL